MENANNYSGKNLRGRNFHDKHLENCNFQDSDIRGASFANANLKGANFNGAKAGLAPYWAIALVIISCIVAALLASVLEFFVHRTVNIIIFTSADTTPETIWDNIWLVGIISVMSVAFIYYIFKSLEAALKVTLTLGIAAIGLTFFQGVIQAGVGIASRNTTESVTGTLIRFLGRNGIGVVTSIGIGVVAVAIAVVITIAEIVGGSKARNTIKFMTYFMVIPPGLFLYKSGADARAIIPGIVLSLPVVFIGNYLVLKVLSGKEEYSLVLNIAVFFASIGGTSFRGADLTDANFTQAVLKSTDFRNSDRKTDLTRTCFADAIELNYAAPGDTILAEPLVRDLLVTRNGQNKIYDGANLRGANLKEASLIKASFKGADISEATLQGAWLEWANLTLTQAVGTDFTSAHMTGACLEAWNIEHTTKLDDVDCRFVYLLENNCERRPSSEEFKFAPGEFTKLFEQVFNTVDLIFQKGIDWKAFIHAFDNVRTELINTKGTEIAVQGIENKGDGVFVVKVAVPDYANKEQIYKELVQEYERQLLEQKQYYTFYLGIKDAEIKRLEEENTNIYDLLRRQADQPIYTTINTNNHKGDIIMSNVKKISHNNLTNAHVVGVVDADAVNVKQIGENINNYPPEQKQNLAQAAAEIKKLIDQLTQNYPTETEPQQKKVAGEVIKQIESNQTLRGRVINVMKAMGIEALQEAIDHPLANILCRGLEEWRESK
ncbi:MAG: pentapeptide repeat-containing protein [Symploca sp. SIO2D2]|nr:pentapeptide repeat-containing protein [Symploca sp. SIO2D2]